MEVLGRVQALGLQVREHVGFVLGGITLAHAGHTVRDGGCSTLGRAFDDGEPLLRKCLRRLLLHATADRGQ